jgi:hypothetical protein
MNKALALYATKFLAWRMLLLATGVVVLLNTAGCGGYRNGSIQYDDNGKTTFSGTNASIFQPPIYPTELANAKMIDAEAYSIKKSADAMEETMRYLREKQTKEERGGGIAKSKKTYVLFFVNNDAHQATYFFDPEYPTQKRILPPNGGAWIMVASSIPHKVVFYNQHTGREITTIYESSLQRVEGDKMVFGVKVDRLYTIHEIYR